MINFLESYKKETNENYKQQFIQKEVVVAKKALDQVAIELQIKVFDNDVKNKPAIVFIHGIGSCKEAFLETGLLQAFEQTHRVVAIDLPGHGKSTMIDQLDKLNHEEKESLAAEYYSLPGIIAQVATALKLLEIRDACIFGWSIGGHITHGLAIKHPELMSSIITTGTPSINYTENELRKGFSEWFVDHIIPTWIKEPNHYSRTDSEMIVKSMGYSEVNAEGRDVYAVNSLMNADPLFRKYLYSTLPSHKDKCELYGRAFLEENKRIPVCMIEGEDDAGCVFKSLQSHFDKHVKGKHQGSRLYSFKKTGHAVFRVRNREFVNAIKQFLSL